MQKLYWGQIKSRANGRKAANGAKFAGARYRAVLPGRNEATTRSDLSGTTGMIAWRRRDQPE